MKTDEHWATPMQSREKMQLTTPRMNRGVSIDHTGVLVVVFVLLFVCWLCCCSWAHSSQVRDWTWTRDRESWDLTSGLHSFISIIYTFNVDKYTESVSFSTALPTLQCLIKKNSHFDMCEMISLSGFDLHFPDDWQCQAFIIYPLAICMSSLEKYLFKTLANFVTA